MSVLIPIDSRRGTAAGASLATGHCLSLSQGTCTTCYGVGYETKLSPTGVYKVACDCTLRAIFRACLSRYNICLMKQWAGSSRVTYNGNLCSRQGEEYITDFNLVARRTLTTAQYRIFTLLRDGRPARDYREVYLVQEQLGRELVNTLPYPLFPLWAYFERSVRVNDFYDAEPGNGMHLAMVA
jgi:hypothetical protein